MNRHKAHWSQMHDYNTDKSQDSIARENMSEDLRKMVDRFGFNDVVTEIRKIKEQENG